MDNKPYTVSPEEIQAQHRFALQVAACPDKPLRYHIVTFGCQMNEHDSETMAGMLEEMGIAQSEDRTEADIVLFNTCCVRENAERKALGNISWLNQIKKERPGMIIGVCGCMIQQPHMAKRILEQYPFIDLAFGTSNLYRLPEYLWQVLSTRQRTVSILENASLSFEGLPQKRTNRIKTYITIMHGCNNYCSYCIVPYVRGRERSRSAEDIVREAEALVRDGAREIMLLGQNVNSYGSGEADAPRFPALLRQVAATGIERIRFMTSHPKDLSDELIDAMATIPSVACHLHLPAQSGSNRILQQMNRKYTVEHYLERVHALKKAIPHLGLTTDLVVAFPGETEADFEDTLALVREVRYDSAFTFIYSPRTGTAAEKLPGRIPDAEATDRIERLIHLQNTITADILSSLQGTTAQVLVEGPSRRDPAQLTGKTARNINVNFSGDPGLTGHMAAVQITGAGSNTLRGVLAKEQ